MARRGVIFIPNEIYFITFTILGWLKLFNNEKYCSYVYKWFDYMKQEYGNLIHGYVIMPNHVHLLIKITDQSPSPSVLIMNAKRFLAYQIVKELEDDNYFEELKLFRKHARKIDKAYHKVFTDRYDCLVIQSRKLFLQKLNYIHNNPCVQRWSLADKPEDYLYSSAANYIIGTGYYKISLIEI